MNDPIYLGRGNAKHEIFRSATKPTNETHGNLYNAVTGPFLTIRGAKAMLWFGENNPRIPTVRDAERIGLMYAEDLFDRDQVRWLN